MAYLTRVGWQVQPLVHSGLLLTPLRLEQRLKLQLLASEHCCDSLKTLKHVQMPCELFPLVSSLPRFQPAISKVVH